MNLPSVQYNKSILILHKLNPQPQTAFSEQKEASRGFCPAVHVCLSTHSGWCAANHPTPFTVCPPRGLPEEPFRKRTAKCSPSERQATDAQAKSVQESLSSQAHSPLGGQNGLTPFPNNTQRICFQFVSLSFLDLKRIGPSPRANTGGGRDPGGMSPGAHWEEDLPLSLEGAPMALLLPCTLIMPQLHSIASF